MWLTLTALLVLVILPRSRPDFNVILPELCGAPGVLNLTWIEAMVRLAIREEQAGHLNIWGTKGEQKFRKNRDFWQYFCVFVQKSVMEAMVSSSF